MSQLNSTSVAAHLAASFEASQKANSKDLPVPGYDGLFVTFKALTDWAAVKGVVVGDPSNQTTDDEIESAAKLLIAASVGSYAIIDGERYDIGLPLGAELYASIFPDAPKLANDVQGVLVLFNNTLALVGMAGDLAQWFAKAGVESTQAVQGKSPAGS